MTDDPDLGPCCACGRRGRSVRTVVMLHVRASQRGKGWGCVVCGLPSDGALAVVCDHCLDAHAPITQACDGYAGGGKRIALSALTEPFDHKDVPHE